MAHLPVNHHLRPLYRTLAALCGLYVLLFGLVGLTQTTDRPAFAQDGLPSVLGLRANAAFGVLSVVAGLTLIVGAFVGRNVDRWINLVGGLAFLGAGIAMMALMQTTLNIFGFTMATCVVSFIIGLVLLTAGLYGQVGSPEVQEREEWFRHSAASDPQRHALGAQNVPRGQGTQPRS